MDKDALAYQFLLVLKSCPQVMVNDLSHTVRNRLLLDSESFQSVEVREQWEEKIRGVCAYLVKLNFIKFNGSKIMLTNKGTEYLNLLYAPIAIDKKEDKESCN